MHYHLANQHCCREILDVSHEICREYKFTGDEVVKIMHPVALHCCDDCHIVVSKDNKRHQIPKQWIELVITVTEGCNLL